MLKKHSKNIVLVLLVLSIGILFGCGTDESNKAYKKESIVYCDESSSGEIINVDGNEYLVVDDNTIGDAIDDKERVCTSHVTDIGELFNSNNEDYFEEIDIGDWDVSNIENMLSTFSDAKSFNQDISNWDVSNVREMRSVFSRADSFNQDISGWDVSNVENMRGMFYHAAVFNQDISNWDVSNVKDMRYMFDGATSFNQDLSGWNVENIESYDNFDDGAENWQDEHKPGFE